MRGAGCDGFQSREHAAASIPRVAPGQADREASYYAMILALLATIASVTLPARAGSGPWTLSEGSSSLYLGTEYRQLRHIAPDGEWFGDGSDLGTSIRFVTVQGVVSYGLLDRFELEATLPWVYAHASRPDAAVCYALGQSACGKVESVGLIDVRGKVRLLDELAGPPVTISVGPVLRIGEFGHTTRARLTAITEGQSDVGAFAVLGRSAGLGASGWWSGYLDAEYRYRIPNIEVGGVKIPSDEVASSAQVMVSPWGVVAFGPELFFDARTGGESLATKDDADPDRFASLKYTLVQYGGKVIVTSNRRWSAIFGATGTLYARDTASDLWSVSAGISWQALPPPVDG